jgi:hypothetical protein
MNRKTTKMKSTLIHEGYPELILIKQSKEAMSLEQRLEINPKVREMLAVADNGIIVYAAIIFHHDLAFRELKKRIEGDRFNDLGELFDLMDQMYPSYHGKAHHKVFDLTWERIIKISKSKPTSEIVDIVKEYGGIVHLLGDDLAIIDEMLEGRNDLDEVANALSSLGFKPDELSLTLKNRPRN